MKSSTSKRQAAAIVARTSDAYSAGRYASWKAVAAALLRRGFTPVAVEALLRSKLTRWAADYSKAPYGRATSRDVLRCLDRNPGFAQDVLREEGLA
jgi:hypothetical protein